MRNLIQRREQPMAALIPTEDVVLNQQRPPARGLLSAVGACADFDEFDSMIENIYAQRRRA